MLPSFAARIHRKVTLLLHNDSTSFTSQELRVAIAELKSLKTGRQVYQQKCVCGAAAYLVLRSRKHCQGYSTL